MYKISKTHKNYKISKHTKKPQNKKPHKNSKTQNQQNKQTKKQRQTQQGLCMMTANAAGMKLKVPSLTRIIHNQNIGIFTLQETHFLKKRKN